MAAEAQKHHRRAPARRHLEEGSLADVTSTYVEGEALELAKYGYSRDKKKGKKQIVFGLFTGEDGCPVAVEVFAGNTALINVNSKGHRRQLRYG